MLTNPPFDYHKYKSPKTIWREDVKTAEELGYPRSVILKLKNEKDPNARIRILKDARSAASEKEEERRLSAYHNKTRD